MLGNSNPCPTIGVKDLAVARKFYEEVLGFNDVIMESSETQQVVYKSGAAGVQIYVTSAAGTNQATYATWEVDDIAAVVSDLMDKGVEFEHYEMPGTTFEAGVHTMADEKAAWFKDPDGNILCLHQKV